MLSSLPFTKLNHCVDRRHSCAYVPHLQTVLRNALHLLSSDRVVERYFPSHFMPLFSPLQIISRSVERIDWKIPRLESFAEYSNCTSHVVLDRYSSCAQTSRRMCIGSFVCTSFHSGHVSNAFDCSFIASDERRSAETGGGREKCSHRSSDFTSATCAN